MFFSYNINITLFILLCICIAIILGFIAYKAGCEACRQHYALTVALILCIVVIPFGLIYALGIYDGRRKSHI